MIITIIFYSGDQTETEAVDNIGQAAALRRPAPLRHRHLELEGLGRVSERSSNFELVHKSCYDLLTQLSKHHFRESQLF